MRCRKSGRWDPKITTPPGLYAFAVAYAQLASRAKAALLPSLWPAAATPVGAYPEERWCGAGVLRQANWCFSLGTLAVMRALLARRMVRAEWLDEKTKTQWPPVHI